MAIDPFLALPLYQQVAEDIRTKIVEGELAVGVQLQPHRDLAAHYGVSLMTINKALSGLVSEGVLHSRVGKGTFVAKKPLAASGEDGPLFGFVLRDLESPYFSVIARSAQQRADETGCGLLFSSTSNSLDREEEQIARFRRLQVDGLIIASMRRTYRLTEAVEALHDESFPYVMVSFTVGDDVPFVGTNLERTGYLATSHLIEVGRRRIAYVSDRSGSAPGDLRKQGYRAALEAAGIEHDPELEFEYLYDGEWNDYRSGYAVGERIASLAGRLDAVFVFNDLGAIGVQDALLDRGIGVPADIAIVGVDDIAQAARARVPLTTVRQPTDRIGIAAVDTLRARYEAKPSVTRQFLEPELIVRASSGAEARVRSWRPSEPAVV